MAYVEYKWFGGKRTEKRRYKYLRWREYIGNRVALKSKYLGKA